MSNRQKYALNVLLRVIVGTGFMITGVISIASLTSNNSLPGSVQILSFVGVIVTGFIYRQLEVNAKKYKTTLIPLHILKCLVCCVIAGVGLNLLSVADVSFRGLLSKPGSLVQNLFTMDTAQLAIYALLGGAIIVVALKIFDQLEDQEESNK